MTVTVAAIQMCSGKQLEENLQRAAQLVAEAVDQGARLVVLPENFAYYGSKNLQEIAQQERTSHGPARQFMAELAASQGVWLVGGTVPVADADFKKGFASCFVYDDTGEEVARYNKIHLFDVDVGDTHNHYRESDDYMHGTKPVVVEAPFGKIGLSVCYDLRFAELYRELAERGAEIIVVPSAFTATTGEAHWQLLLRARAVENQCFVIGANMGERDHPRKPTWGESMIVHPWGKVLNSLGGGEGVVCAEIDLAEISRLKSRMPIASHRRL